MPENSTRPAEADPAGPPPPSIFNDVIGPVMRGPSSSHCAAAVRIGRMVRELLGGHLSNVRVTFDAHGSLAATYDRQGTDVGLCAGLLGWEVTDNRLTDAVRAIAEAGIAVEFVVTAWGAQHPNTIRLTVENPTGRRTLTALSTGGGMVEIVDIDGVPISMTGDDHETVIFTENAGSSLARHLETTPDVYRVRVYGNTPVQIVRLQSRTALNRGLFPGWMERFPIREIRTVTPVLPVLSGNGSAVPFLTGEAMHRFNADRHLSLWELACCYESRRSGLSTSRVFDKMAEIVRIMKASIRRGIAGTAYEDRILGCQSGRFGDKMETGDLLDAGILNRMILYITAIMEVKSAWGVIVAAPTAGACSGLPGACLGAAESLGLPEERITQAMLAAGMIGVFIAAHATFAAEVGGCQAECGAGSGMAAAALVTLAGGSAEQATTAAAMALQNILGMVCDPVANRVEVPCLGKNVLAAANALACANMALAGYDPVIPLDEVIGAMDAVGQSLPPELRCTAKGGLSITPTSLAIHEKLDRTARSRKTDGA